MIKAFCGFRANELEKSDLLPGYSRSQVFLSFGPISELVQLAFYYLQMIISLAFTYL